MVALGLRIEVFPEKAELIKKMLDGCDSLRVRNITADHNRIVAVVESEYLEDEPVISRQISEIDGVIDIDLAFYRFMN